MCSDLNLVASISEVPVQCRTAPAKRLDAPPASKGDGAVGENLCSASTRLHRPGQLTEERLHTARDSNRFARALYIPGCLPADTVNALEQAPDAIMIYTKPHTAWAAAKGLTRRSTI